MIQQINFTIKPSIEFINSLFLVSQQEKILQRAEKVNFTPGLAEVELFNELQSDLSDYMMGEINYFFSQELPIGYLMALKVILEEDDISSVKDLINQLENSNALELIHYVLQRYEIDCELQPRAMVKEIRQADHLSADLQETLVETIKNPVETLQRYWFMLRQFYLKAYQKMEEPVLREIADHKQKLRQIYQDNPDYFIKYYLKLDGNQTEKPVNIHISFFFQTMCDYYETDSEIWVNMGCYLDQVYGEEAFRERIQEFLQFVADKTRFRMMELLGARPHYGRELAEELDIKPSTVSYHLSRLEKMDLVQVKRKKHKVFYSLACERLTELFGQAGDFILRDTVLEEDE